MITHLEVDKVTVEKMSKTWSKDAGSAYSALMVQVSDHLEYNN